MVCSCGTYLAYSLYRLLHGGPPLPDPEAGTASIEVKIEVRGPEAADPDGGGPHDRGTFEDEIKTENDKANISADMNDSNAGENENPGKSGWEEVTRGEHILDIPVGDLVDLSELF